MRKALKARYLLQYSKRTKPALPVENMLMTCPATKVFKRGAYLQCFAVEPSRSNQFPTAKAAAFGISVTTVPAQSKAV